MTVLQTESWRTIFLKDLDFTVSQAEDQSVGFVLLAVIRLEAPGLNFILLKPAFKKASTTMIAFERMFTSPHGSAADRVIEWLKCQLLSGSQRGLGLRP